jgi:Flp pilus assembly protein TadG
MMRYLRSCRARLSVTHGQIIIFVAVVAVGMLGMLGLATDLGYTFAQKRSAQNAADAAALAGSRAVTQWSTTNTTVTALPVVQTIAKDNDMGQATQKITCFYVDDTNKDLADCSAKVPATATGVQVKVSETHSTFFIWIIPGAPKTVTTSASATAHAQTVQPDGSGAPFILCGASANMVGGGSEVTILQ